MSVSSDMRLPNPKLKRCLKTLLRTTLSLIRDRIHSYVCACIYMYIYIYIYLYTSTFKGKSLSYLR